MTNWGTGRASTAVITACALMTGCATPYQNGRLSAEGESPDYMTVQQDHRNPCDESSRREEVFAKSIVGALFGGVIGYGVGTLADKILGNKDRQLAKGGAATGFTAGLIAGYNNGVDTYRRQCDIYKAVQARNAEAVFATLQLGSEAAGEIVVSPDEDHFYPNSDQLTAKGNAYYKEVAKQYTSQAQLASYEATVRSAAKRDQRMADQRNYRAGEADKKRMEQRWSELRIILTGHTDDQADAKFAQRLSENRARTVAALFRQAGVPESSLLYQGAGASFPIADNNTAEGRKKNNRVEVVVLYGERSIHTYVESRQPSYELFSPRQQEPVSGNRGARQRAPATTILPRQPASPAPAQITKAPDRKTGFPPYPRSSSPGAPKETDSTVKQTTAVPSETAVAVIRSEPGLDFGGVPLLANRPNMVTQLGKLHNASGGFSLAGLFGVRPAYASDGPLISSCDLDDAGRYKVGEIRRLGDSSAVNKKSPISIADAYLGIVKRSYSAPAANHYVEVKNLSAKKNGELAEAPQFNVFYDFQTKSAEEKKRVNAADYSVQTIAFAVRGEGGLLVRQFFPKEKGLVCMDMLIPNNLAHKQVRDAALIYTYNGIRKIADLALER